MAKQAKQFPPLEIELSLVQEEFVFSNDVVNVIISSTGEGKSFAAVVAMLVHAQRNAKPIRCAIVRDTHENIKLSTVMTIRETLGERAVFRNDCKQLKILCDPQIDVDLFGIDDDAALSKLQGPEYALIWLEEPAPMTNRSNAGLAEAVFNASLLRCARQAGTFPRLQVSMNPADEDHWTYRRFILDKDIDTDNPLITKKVLFVPYGENTHLSDFARQAAKVAYKDDPASYERYVEGKFAAVYHGCKVTPDYKPKTHLSDKDLVPLEGLETFIGFDGWHSASCIVGQIMPNGRLLFIDTLRTNGGDIRTLITTLLMPLLEGPRWKGKPRVLRTIGDRTMMIPDQSNRHETSAKVIEKALGTRFEPGPSQWSTIRSRIQYALNHGVEGESLILINRQCRVLDKALSGAWFYKTDTSGNVIKDLPEKTPASHVADAWANAVSVLLPSVNVKTNLSTIRAMGEKTRRRNRTYAGRG